MIRTDCRHYRGDKPCRYGFPCDGCGRYDSVKTKVLVLKCRAQGDVLRTTALLPAIKRQYPQSHVTWLVDEESVELLLNIPFIDRIAPFTMEGLLPFLAEKYDVLISLDKEPGIIAVASAVRAARKFGFGMNERGQLVVFNTAAEYAWRLGMDDELKFRLNRKTYQEIAAEAAEVPYKGDEYVYILPQGADAKAKALFKAARLPKGRLTVGLNTGAGTKFETKQWPAGHFLKLIGLLHRHLKAGVFLLGGPREQKLNGHLARRAAGRAHNTGTDNTLAEFAGFLSLMDVVVCSDTLAMHMAIALKKKVIALFGPTSPQEIDLYGRGEKLFAGADCAPCFKQTCEDGSCMKAITAEQVFEAVRRQAKG